MIAVVTCLGGPTSPDLDWAHAPHNGSFQSDRLHCLYRRSALLSLVPISLRFGTVHDSHPNLTVLYCSQKCEVDRPKYIQLLLRINLQILFCHFPILNHYY